MTFPLAMNVSTLESPSDSNSSRSRSIFTLCPPTLIARRKAMNRVILSPDGSKDSLLTNPGASRVSAYISTLPATMVDHNTFVSFAGKQLSRIPVSKNEKL